MATNRERAEKLLKRWLAATDRALLQNVHGSSPAKVEADRLQAEIKQLGFDILGGALVERTSK